VPWKPSQRAAKRYLTSPVFLETSFCGFFPSCFPSSGLAALNRANAQPRVCRRIARRFPFSSLFPCLCLSSCHVVDRLHRVSSSWLARSTCFGLAEASPFNLSNSRTRPRGVRFIIHVLDGSSGVHKYRVNSRKRRKTLLNWKPTLAPDGFPVDVDTASIGIVVTQSDGCVSDIVMGEMICYMTGNVIFIVPIGVFIY
jgi:hypothetical protein